MNRCYMLWYTTLCRALRGTYWVGWFVITRRVRHGYASEPFLCIPLASASVPEASLLSSGLRLYRTLIRCYRGCQSPPEEGSCAGAGSRWCFHLLGTFPQDPYVAYASGRYAAEARGGLSRARRATLRSRSYIYERRGKRVKRSCGRLAEQRLGGLALSSLPLGF